MDSTDQKTPGTAAAVLELHRAQQGLYVDGSLQCGCRGKYLTNADWAAHAIEALEAAGFAVGRTADGQER